MDIAINTLVDGYYLKGENRNSGTYLILLELQIFVPNYIEQTYKQTLVAKYFCKTK